MPVARAVSKNVSYDANSSSLRTKEYPTSRGVTSCVRTGNMFSRYWSAQETHGLIATGFLWSVNRELRLQTRQRGTSRCATILPYRAHLASIPEALGNIFGWLTALPTVVCGWGTSREHLRVLAAPHFLCNAKHVYNPTLLNGYKTRMMIDRV